MSLIDRHCMHGAPALDDATIQSLLTEVPDWRIDGNRLQREFVFRDFHETMEFVNALAFMIHREDHHPELTVGYRRCTASWTTHSAGNRLSDNDFICAAKADALYAGRAGA
ncbi:4a-hydroxytetrahydrobiopterin dehydratase [Massilia sp. CT11-137]|uniref:4a-hydroxytetrahydrobiopterin dehydratase n=1 Tax=Massilia sp. CT11-137 TaxID=3393901 RepID=UPI0039AF104F